MLIDTHAHLYWDSYKADFDEVIKRAIDVGISTIINIGVDVEKSQQALDQVKNTKWPKRLSVYSTIGIHPHEAIKYQQSQMSSDRGTNIQRDLVNDITQLEEIYRGNPRKVVGVGECGLDYYFDPEFTPSSLTANQIKSLQKKLFQTQIMLAKKLNLPLIVHCRDDRSKNPQNSECWDKVIDMTKNHFGIYHCYSGFTQTTNYLLQTTNFLVAFAANITYPKNEYLRETAKLIPLERIVLETDSPFLAPQSRRGQRNEPSSVKEIAQLIADLKGISLEEVATQTTKNTIQILRLRSG